jgi:hypothetical protein
VCCTDLFPAQFGASVPQVAKSTTDEDGDARTCFAASSGAFVGVVSDWRDKGRNHRGPG